jgi:hypothetical protein
MKLADERWTLVQHSAFGYQEKPGWDKAVETRRITTTAELERVKSVGGYIFTSYGEADTQEYKSNYPKGAGDTLTYPEVLGTFSHKEIDGLKIYMPATKVEVIG